MMEIEELQTPDEWREAFQLLREFRQNLAEQDYLCLLEEMRQEGYRLFALRDSGVIISLAGIAVRTNFHDGRHVWVYDLVTTSTARSRGHGRHLLEFIENFAREQNCKTIALASGLQRIDAHRFYEKHMSYDRTSYVLKKKL